MLLKSAALSKRPTCLKPSSTSHTSTVNYVLPSAAVVATLKYVGDNQTQTEPEGSFMSGTGYQDRKRGACRANDHP